MKNRILLFAALLAGCMFTTSCTKDGGKGENEDSEGKTTIYGKEYAPINVLNIVGADYLYTVKSEGEISLDARTRSTITTNVTQLFKVLSNGNTEEVVVIDSNGETIPVTNIVIQQATDDLIYFSFTYEIKTVTVYDDGYYDVYSDYYSHCYFVRKSDGGVFEIPDPFGGAILNAYKDNNQFLYCDTYPISNNNDDDGAAGPPPAVMDIYKIESRSGVTATKLIGGVPAMRLYGEIAGNQKSAIIWTVDRLGNLLYINNYGNVRCITPNGKNFMLNISQLWSDEQGEAVLQTGEVIPIENVAVVNKLVPMMNSATGGFLLAVQEFDEFDNYVGEYLAHCIINEQTESFDVVRLCDYQWGEWITLNDRVVIIGDGVITTIKSPTDIEIVNCQTPSNGGYTTTGNYIYWVDNNQIYQLDYISGNSTMIHQLNSSWDYHSFSFAENLILFYGIDRPNEKTYKCEIRNGAYMQTEIEAVTDQDSLPTIIDFMRVN